MSALDIAITRLAQNAGVTAITTSRNIYPISAPQNATAPYLIVNVVSTRDERMLTGAGRYPRSRVSVECVASTPTGAMALGAAVMAALDNIVKANVGSFSSVDSLFADTDVTIAADDRSSFKRTLDFFIRHREE